MELTCRFCGKSFQTAEGQKWAKYCPSCQKQAYMVRIQNRDSELRAAKRRQAILDPGPAHMLDLDTVLRELDQFNALRRAEGHGVVSYGRYVAMRDGYIQIADPNASRRNARKSRSKTVIILMAEAEGM